MRRKTKIFSLLLAFLTAFSTTLMNVSTSLDLDSFYKLTSRSNKTRSSSQQDLAINSIEKRFNNNISQYKDQQPKVQENTGSPDGSIYYYDNGNPSIKNFPFFWSESTEYYFSYDSSNIVGSNAFTIGQKRVNDYKGQNHDFRASKTQYGLLLFDISYTLPIGYALDTNLIFNFTYTNQIVNNLYGFNGGYEFFVAKPTKTLTNILSGVDLNTTTSSSTKSNIADEVGYSAVRVNKQHQGTYTQQIKVPIQDNLISDSQMSKTVKLSFGLFLFMETINLNTEQILNVDIQTYDKVYNSYSKYINFKAILGAVTSAKTSKLFYREEDGIRQLYNYLTNQDLIADKNKQDIYLFDSIDFSSYSQYQNLDITPSTNNIILGQGVYIKANRITFGVYNSKGNTNQRITVKGFGNSSIQANTITYNHNLTFDNVELTNVKNIIQGWNYASTAYPNLTVNLYFMNGASIKTNSNLSFDYTWQVDQESNRKTIFFTGTKDKPISIVANEVNISQALNVDANYVNISSNHVEAFGSDDVTFANSTIQTNNSISFSKVKLLSLVKSKIESKHLNVRDIDRTDLSNSSLDIKEISFNNTDLVTTIENDGVKEYAYDLYNTNINTERLYLNNTYMSTGVYGQTNINFIRNSDYNEAFVLDNFSYLNTNRSTILSTSSDILLSIKSSTFNYNGGQLKADEKVIDYYSGDINIDLDKYDDFSNLLTSNSKSSVMLYLSSFAAYENISVHSLNKNISRFTVSAKDSALPKNDGENLRLIRIGAEASNNQFEFVRTSYESDDVYNFALGEVENDFLPLIVTKHSHSFTNLVFDYSNCKTVYTEGDYFNEQGLRVFAECTTEGKTVEVYSYKYTVSPLEAGQNEITFTVSSNGKTLTGSIPIQVNYKQKEISIDKLLKLKVYSSKADGISSNLNVNVSVASINKDIDKSYRYKLREDESLAYIYSFEHIEGDDEDTYYRFTFKDESLSSNLEVSKVIQYIDDSYIQLPTTSNDKTNGISFETTDYGDILIITKDSEHDFNSYTSKKETINTSLLVVAISIGSILLLIFGTMWFILYRENKKRKKYNEGR